MPNLLDTDRWALSGWRLGLPACLPACLPAACLSVLGMPILACRVACCCATCGETIHVHRRLVLWFVFVRDSDGGGRFYMCLLSTCLILLPFSWWV